MKRFLGRFCADYGATVLTLGHPSKASQADGSNYSGNTAHNAAVRSRMVIKQPTKESTLRVLEVAKSNYGATGEIELFFFGPGHFNG